MNLPVDKPAINLASLPESAGTGYRPVRSYAPYLIVEGDIVHETVAYSVPCHYPCVCIGRRVLRKHRSRREARRSSDGKRGRELVGVSAPQTKRKRAASRPVLVG
jgi:hypothetical protein